MMWVQIPPNHPIFGAVAERRMHFAVDEEDDGSSPFGPANFLFLIKEKPMFALKGPSDHKPFAT